MSELNAISSGLVLPLVLLAAALHATWNALVKANGDRLAINGLVMLAPALACLPLLPFLPLPAPAAWPYLLASVLLHIGYNALLVAAYRHGDLSQVYPIARGSAPILVAMGGWLLAGEAKTPGEMLAIAVVSAGILALALRKGAPRPRQEQAVPLAFLVGLFIAAYSLVDGLGGRASGSVGGYIAWLFAIQGPLFMGLVAWCRRGRLLATFRPILLPGLGGGMMAGLAYGIVIWAMSLVPMAHVVALRETSVLMAAAIGAYLLKEGFGAQRIAASLFVVAGSVMLQLLH